MAINVISKCGEMGEQSTGIYRRKFVHGEKALPPLKFQASVREAVTPWTRTRQWTGGPRSAVPCGTVQI